MFTFKITTDYGGKVMFKINGKASFYLKNDAVSFLESLKANKMVEEAKKVFHNLPWIKGNNQSKDLLR